MALGRVGPQTALPVRHPAWLVSGYEQSKAVLADATGWSNDFSNLTAITGGGAAQDKDPGGLGMADPPKHTRLRHVPFPDREGFQRLSTGRFELFGGIGTGLDAISESLTFMSELVAQQRERPGRWVAT